MKSVKKHLASAFAAAALVSASTYASATVITFDDVPAGGTATEITDGYRGLDWDNYFVLDAFQYNPNSGYAYGVVSGKNVAGNGFGDPASFSSSTPFSLQSLYLTKAWYNGFTRIEGYSGTTLAYSVDIYSSTTVRTFAYLHWGNLTKVVLSSPDGSWQTAVDNIMINEVPEPETYAMLLAGLGILGFAARRKRTAASSISGACAAPRLMNDAHLESVDRAINQRSNLSCTPRESLAFRVEGG